MVEYVVVSAGRFRIRSSALAEAVVQRSEVQALSLAVDGSRRTGRSSSSWRGRSNFGGEVQDRKDEDFQRY